MFKDFILNGAILISAFAVFGNLLRDFHLNDGTSKKLKFIWGIIFGILGAVLMYFSIRIDSHTIADLRHIATVFAAALGGFIPAIVSAFVIGLARIVIFGVSQASINAAVLMLLIGVVCGQFSKLKFSFHNKTFWMNLISLLIIALSLFLNIENKDMLPYIYTYHFSISLIGGFLSYQIIVYFIKSNEAFKKLQESEEKYRLLTNQYESVVNNVKEVIFQTNVDGQWTFLNPPWTDITGFSIDECIHTSFLNYVHPEDREEFVKSFEKNKEYHKQEVRFITKENGYKWIEVFSRLSFNHQGIIIGAAGTLYDVSERKAIEEETLRTSSRLHALITHLPYGIIAEDEENRLTIINTQFIEMFNCPIELTQLVGTTVNGLPSMGIDCFNDVDSYNHRREEILRNKEYVLSEEIYLNDGRIIERDAIPIYSQDAFSGYLWQFKDITARKTLEEELKEASIVDGLTGIPNRRYFDETIIRDWNLCTRNSRALSLIMFDIDYFKNFNDTYGHLRGDECLREVAQTVKACLKRSSDVVCRYGGEEFAVILPETNNEGALIVAEKIKSAIDSLAIPHIGSDIGSITASVGIATIIPGPFSDPKVIIGRADIALYNAKKAGRNTIKHYEKELQKI